ncbi:unnamed protein product, partial [marine sediment metagenome]
KAVVHTLNSTAVATERTICCLLENHQNEISQDPNCPMYARTKLWNIVSILETVRD